MRGENYLGSHEVIIKQDIYRKTYYVGLNIGGGTYYYTTKPSEEYVETDIIWSGKLDSPVLEVGDELYISELDDLVVVRKVIRTTYNEHIYFTKTIIEDELTKESLLKAEEGLAETRLEKERDTEEVEELEEWIEKKPNWLQRIFK